MASQMDLSKEIVINKPVSEVFDFIKITKNQNRYSVWNMADPEMKTEYTGTDGQVGFIYKWDSKKGNVGAGEQELKKIQAPNKIDYELRFLRPMKNISYSSYILSSVGTDKTKVEWTFSGPTKFPMSLFKSFLKKMLGKDMEKSLQNLKMVLEK